MTSRRTKRIFSILNIWTLAWKLRTTMLMVDSRQYIRHDNVFCSRGLHQTPRSFASVHYTMCVYALVFESAHVPGAWRASHLFPRRRYITNCMLGEYAKYFECRHEKVYRKQNCLLMNSVAEPGASNLVLGCRGKHQRPTRREDQIV